MPDPNYRFGPFLVDRISYRVLCGQTPVELTPKLLDLLLHLLDHAGALVTKEQLMDALWPDANVTENALAQAVSELRQALGDDANAPVFIKTVARRGYRFVSPVERIEAAAPAPAPEDHAESIAVMNFTNVTGDPDAAWLSAGIAETVAADLRTLGRYRVIDRGRVMEAARRGNGTLEEIAAELNVPLAVVGGYQAIGDRIRITSRIVNVKNGEALADAKVDGPLTGIFELQDRVVEQFSKELGLTAPLARNASARETPSLEAFRAFTEGWLQIETLHVGELPKAIANFEKAIAIDPHYVLAYTGLASAQLAAYHATRADNAPSADLLNSAIANARKALTLDDTLAEAHATLGFVLVSAWETAEAVRETKAAVALEPGNWRHCFRLGYAAWGDERLRAAGDTLSLYPDFAFAHFQMAMVHVARGHLRDAETVLRQGAAVQDRQMGRGDRYPALGLHWLLGSVRLAQGDTDEALREFAREMDLAQPHRLFGREYRMSALFSRGATLLRLERHDEAIAAFNEALALYPEHAPSMLGLALALRGPHARDRAAEHLSRVRALLPGLHAARPIEAALVRGQLEAAEGNLQAAGTILHEALGRAPAGFAGWTLPIEPLLHQAVSSQAFRAVLQLLADRAR
jgi:DNA-binding winged helix-turn-helix (wHTH) protein/Flp pilus assembly protein TadD